ncbi:GNAT family N-acetyltransferase [Alteromonas halophila]|nr:GNAT family N-acetyltransferase [Alteromonas halophila]
MAFHVEHIDWQLGQERLRELRESVFIIEWQLPRDTEFDEHDEHAFHVLLSDENQRPVATGRLTRDGQIGRIAVSPRHRTKVVYQQLFAALIAIAKAQNVPELQVICDLDSVKYHRQLGFAPRGPAFMEAGIPRQRMVCDSQSFPLPDVLHMH